MAIKRVITKRRWLCLGCAAVTLRALLTRLRARVEGLVPMGYQDSAGFHFGVPD